MKHRKQISLALCLLLVALNALSCGGGETVTDVTTASDNGSEVTTEEVGYKLPEADYGGKTFTFYEDHYVAGGSAYALVDYNYIDAESENADVINDAIYRRTNAVEELLNVKIDVYSDEANDVGKFQSSILAGDDEYQAALIRLVNAGKLLGDGALYDLRSIDTLDLEADWVNQNANDEYTINDKQFYINDASCLRTLISSGVIYFNKQIVEDYKLDNPYKLVDSGDWTFDTFGKMVRQTSEDVNGDNQMDENDRFGFSGSKTVLNQGITSAGVRITTKDANGMSQITLNNDRTVSMIEKLLPVLADFKVNALPSNFSSKATGGDVWFSVLLPMFKSDKLFMNFNWLFYAMDLRDMDTDFGILPMPKLDSAQDAYYSQLSEYWADLIAVPASNSDPDMAGNVLTAMGYYSNEYVKPEIIERAVSTKSMRDDDSARMMEIINDGIVFDLYDLYKWGGLINSVSGTLNAGTNNFSSAFASLKDTAEAAIKTTFDTLQ